MEVLKAFGHPSTSSAGWLHPEVEGAGDPNDWRLVKNNAVGIRYPPLATNNHERTGTREFLIATAKRYPNNLKIELDALVTRVLFDDTQKAIGVEYVKGARLYRAHVNPSAAAGALRQVYVSHEVILSGGAFNTPQLLMLSGIGPKEELERSSAFPSVWICQVSAPIFRIATKSASSTR